MNTVLFTRYKHTRIPRHKENWIDFQLYSKRANTDIKQKIFKQSPHVNPYQMIKAIVRKYSEKNCINKEMYFASIYDRW